MRIMGCLVKNVGKGRDEFGLGETRHGTTERPLKCKQAAGQQTSLTDCDHCSLSCTLIKSYL